MIDTYKSLRDLLDTQLNNNSYGIIFNTTLFDSKKITYNKKVYNSEDYTTTTKKNVPAHIEDIPGNFINVPNTSVLEAQIGMTFDIFTKEYTDLETPELQDKFQSVSYRNTMLAIDEVRKNLLAKYFPLGDSGIYFGGTDSQATFSFDIPFTFNTIYIELDIQDTDSSLIFKAENDVNHLIKLEKTTSNLIFTSTIAGGSVAVSLPYTTGMNEIYVYYDSQDKWNMTLNGVNGEASQPLTQNSFNGATISVDKDYFGVLYQLLIDNTIIQPIDIERGLETKIPTPKIDFRDFTSRYELNQEGELALLTNSVVDSVLWGKNGNVVFGFENLVPISDLRYQDESQPRQIYALGIPLLISFDVLFGNLFEYSIDGVELFPIDRQHTFGTVGDSEQYFGEKFGKHIIESNAKDKTQTFFYKPSKKLNELMKQLTKNDIEQNKEFALIVQYPFYKETYTVVIDSGGINANTNQLSTLTVTYKQKDDNIV